MRTIKSFRRKFLFPVILFICNISAYSQNAEDLFVRTGPEIVWLGVDFTQVKLYGDHGTVGQDELIPLFDAINRLIITEREKYNLADALRRDDIPFNLEMVTKLNSGINPGSLFPLSSAEEKSRLDEDAISVLVKQYDVPDSEGIGLIFFMESIDKTTERGTMWVTFFRLADRNLLFTEKLSGTAGGFGFRNHWARTVYEVISQIRDERFARWRTRYTRLGLK
ncbi:MAG: hypothetical protein JXR66_03720 [Bacteroidales bacterium]|nr:hypothetical protein [Bacteroidales bacterium]